MFYGRFWGGKGLLICVCDKGPIFSKKKNKKTMIHCSECKKKKNALLEIYRNIQPTKNKDAPKETPY